jgi:hypothetical protein
VTRAYGDPSYPVISFSDVCASSPLSISSFVPPYLAVDNESLTHSINIGIWNCR